MAKLDQFDDSEAAMIATAHINANLTFPCYPSALSFMSPQLHDPVWPINLLGTKRERGGAVDR